MGERWNGKAQPNFTVHIHNNPPQNYIEEKTFEKNNNVVERVTEVCGAVGYSVCFRNSEHVSRYICNGVWTSAQMLPGANPYKSFEAYMDEHHRQLVNTKPNELVRRKPEQELYKDVTPFVRYERSPQAIDRQDLDAFNVVFLGPTGCGKSHLVNHFFNKTVSVSAGTAESVTRDIHFFIGSAMLGRAPTDDVKEWHLQRRKVNLVDTIGLCDSALPATLLQELIQQKLKGNFAYIDRVVIVCSGRIERGHQEAIHQFMKWLSFDQYAANFTFIYNKADTVDEEEREQDLFQMCKLLKTGDTVRSCRESLLPSSIIGQVPRLDLDGKGPATGRQRQLTNRYALGFPPRVQYADISTDLESLLNSTMSPIEPVEATEYQRIPLSEEACAIL